MACRRSPATPRSRPVRRGAAGLAAAALTLALGVEPAAAAPDTQLDATPPALSSQSSATFAFSGGSTYACALDAAPAHACSSPVVLTGLADGQHTFSVTASDPRGVPDPTPASFTWTVDTTPPETAIVSAPTGLQGWRDYETGKVVVAFTASEPATFGCSQPTADLYVACGSPRTITSPPGPTFGLHAFSVRAVDLAGNVDPTPAIAQWSYDVASPSPSLALYAQPPYATTRRPQRFVLTRKLRLAFGSAGPDVSPPGSAPVTYFLRSYLGRVFAPSSFKPAAAMVPPAADGGLRARAAGQTAWTPIAGLSLPMLAGGADVRVKKPGDVACVAVVAIDAAGNANGGGGADLGQCTTLPLRAWDALLATGWKKRLDSPRDAGHFLGQYAVSTKVGSVLKFAAGVVWPTRHDQTPSSLTHVGLVATRCRGCGVVEVFGVLKSKKTFSAKVNLNSRTKRKRSLIVRKAADSSRIFVRHVASGPVVVEGLGVASDPVTDVFVTGALANQG